MKKVPKICLNIGPNKFSKTLDHILCKINHIVASLNLSRHLSPNRQISADSVGDAFCDRKGKCKVDKQIPKESKPMKELCKASWCKPQPGWMKINTDASFLAETGTAHWGAIIRDHEGKTILSAWSPIDRCNSAAEAEVKAALEGLRIAACLNMPTVLESDCQYVVDCLSNHVLDRSQACFIVDEAIAVADTIPSLKVVKVHRDGNLAAHKLAAYSRSVLSSGVLHYSVPTCIREQVMHECNLNEFE
jgi:ribonuclease HI